MCAYVCVCVGACVRVLLTTCGYMCTGWVEHNHKSVPAEIAGAGSFSCIRAPTYAYGAYCCFPNSLVTLPCLLSSWRAVYSLRTVVEMLRTVPPIDPAEAWPEWSISGYMAKRRNRDYAKMAAPKCLNPHGRTFDDRVTIPY